MITAEYVVIAIQWQWTVANYVQWDDDDEGEDSDDGAMVRWCSAR